MTAPDRSPSDRRKFARAQSIWLDQVARDRSLPPSAVAVAVAIALTSYFNRNTGLAWPSHDTLAAKLGVSARSVGNAISKMIDGGHLGIVGDRRGGRQRTNRYYMIIKTPKGGTPVPGFMAETRKARSTFTSLESWNEPAGKVERSCTKGGTALPTNLLDEPIYESSATDLVKMDVKTWFSKASQRNGMKPREFAYECFKRAPDRALDIDTQIDKFSEFNVGKRFCDQQWWRHWESWCNQAVDYWRSRS